MATFQLRGQFLRNLKSCHTQSFLESETGISHSKGSTSASIVSSPMASLAGKIKGVRFSENGANNRPEVGHASRIPVYKPQPPRPLHTSTQPWSKTTPAEEIDTTSPVQLAKCIFSHGLKNVLPSKLITSKVTLQGSLLKLGNAAETTVDLSQYNKKYVVGFGKACLPMAETLLPMMNGIIDRCVISIPSGSRACKIHGIEAYCGAENNIPDENSFQAAQEIVSLVRACTPQDLLIILISGGGSALLPYPIPPVTLDEKKNLIRHLSRAGCSISDLNSIRKRLSLVKGGGLVHMCRAKKVISLIISDVTGNPMDTIASGPTVPNLDDPTKAWKILEKYGLDEDVPQSIQTVLKSPRSAVHFEDFDKVTNFIIGDNELALEAASSAAMRYGLHPYVVTSELRGEAAEVGGDLAGLAEALAYFLNYASSSDDPLSKPHLDAINKIFKTNRWSTVGIIPEVFDEADKGSKGICLLFGGETIVKVKGSGLGGRNQELTLAAGIRLDMSRNLPWVKDKVAILSAGTDGFDGPNTAAGAVIEGRTINDAQLEGLSPVIFLKENDSFNFFSKAAFGKYHIVSGHTETNVMDIAIIVILKKNALNRIARKSSL